MTKRLQEFTGKDVAEAIATACEALGLAQEALQIEVLATGTQGIFGLCKKKAHIRVVPREGRGVVSRPRSRSVAEAVQAEDPVQDGLETPFPGAVGGVAAAQLEHPVQVEEPLPEITSSLLEQIGGDIRRMLELMGMPSQVELTVDRETILCRIGGDYVDDLIGPEGRVLDSLQYVQRKMLGNSLPERAVLSLDAANYRETRLQDLRLRALDLAAEALRSGRSLTLPALSPAERRIVHVALREQPQIKSRSVGDGPFKKVLISPLDRGQDERGPREAREERPAAPRRPRGRGRSRENKPPSAD